MLDARSISVIAATILFGPPQAAPMAMRVLESDLSGILLFISLGHLGSALVLFLFFQAIQPLMERLRGYFGGLWLRIRSPGDRSTGARKTLNFTPLTPGGKYFFLGTVAFVFAFGSFLGVAATQTVGMRRTRAFLAVMLGCGLSVVFWVLAAYYLTRMIDPVYVTLGFILFATALMWRGKILRSRAVRELTNMGMDSLRVMYLIAEHADVNRIAESTQMRMDQLGKIVEDLMDNGFIAQGGIEVYQLTQKGLKRLGSVPKWIRVSLDLDKGEETNEDT